MATPHLELEALLTRRSSKPEFLGDPGPTPDQLGKILTAAARVPDHKKLAPWRFVVFEGAARAKFGEVLAATCAKEEKMAPSEARLQLERGRFLRSPVVIGVISRTEPNPAAPEWEQVLSAGAATFNLCLAANALGFGSAWITEWYAYSPGVAAALGLKPNEKIAGFVYLGTMRQAQADRDRPNLNDIVSRYPG